MSEVWEPVTTYCGCVIERMWSPLFEYYLYRSPCDPHLRTSLEATKNYIESQGHCGAPPPPPPTEGFQINVTVSPAVSGILVQLWWVLGGVPAMITDTINTDSNGQVSFNPGSTGYPVYMRVIVPAGQMIGGTEYGGDESGDLECYEGSVFNVSLTLSSVAKKPTTFFIDVTPISGIPPYNVTISVHLRNEIWMSNKTVKIYKNNNLLSTLTTDSGGWVQLIDTVTKESSYYASFAGDSEYDGSISSIITVAVEAPVGIPTTLTLSAPSKTGIGEKFNISGILYETGTGIPIPSQPINHSYNGRGLGTSITGIDGQYLKEVSVPESGVWTLKSEFPGTEGLQASRAQVDSVVAATPLATALQIAGPIATAIALFAYKSS